jgi:hypothetical protein
MDEAGREGAVLSGSGPGRRSGVFQFTPVFYKAYTEAAGLKKSGECGSPRR